jgi:hypothetical protein
MKRLYVLFLVSTFLPCVFAAVLAVQVDALHPDQIPLSWQGVEGVGYYDLYLNKEPMVHTQASKAVLGSNERPLTSHTQYEILIAARKQGVREIAVDRFVVKTASIGG